MLHVLELLHNPAILEYIPTAVYVIDSVGLIRSFNKRAAEFWGRRPKILDADDRYCGSFKMFLPDGTSLPHDKTPMKAAIQDGEVCKNVEVEILRPDGTRITVIANITPLWDEHGKIVGAINAFQDITEIVNARRKVDFQQRELEMRDRFLSICSHELKTPLTSLMCRNQFAQRKISKSDRSVYEPDRVNEMVQRNCDQLNRLNRLVDDLLDVQRVRTGRLAIHLETVDLVSLVREVVSTSGEGADNLAGLVTVEAEGQVEGRFDRHRIEQVITNLFTNSIKYGAHRPVQVKVEHVGDRAKIEFRDHGLGIAEEDYGRIFEPFERAHSENGIPGMGLGLYVTKQIVEAHRGQIYVHSALGAGTTFTVDLPVSALLKAS
jgi:PAS domain S-box-containing protein